MAEAAAGSRGVVAVTGATGFIGRRLIPRLAAAGWTPRLLLRRDPADLAWGGVEVEVVPGHLGDEAALAALLRGSRAVVHLAGLIKATTTEAFMAANRDGTRRLCAALREQAPEAHPLIVSSLAARHPELSSYAASKRAGEDVARELLGTRLSIVRPPAVYGPGDRETLAFFQMVATGWLPLLGRPEARNAIVHVDDLCRALLCVLDGEPNGRTAVVTDGRPEGYGWDEILSAAARAQGIEPRGRLQVPRWALRALAAVGDVRKRMGSAEMVTSEKLRELLHADWSVPADERLLPPGWAPEYDLATGFADAVRFYRQHGWLPPR